MADLVLVERAFAQPGDEQFPEAAGDVLAHRMAAAVPAVEVADDADAGGVGGPDGEIHAVDAVDRAKLRPQAVVALPVPAFVQQVQIVVGQQVRKGVRIVHGQSSFPLRRRRGARSAISPLLSGNGQMASNKPAGWIRRIGRAGVGVDRIDHPGLGRLRQKRPHRQRPAPRLVTSCGPRSSKGFSCLPSISCRILSNGAVVRTRTSLQIF